LMSEDYTYQRLGRFFDAARIKKILKESNIGFIGNSVYTGMLDLAVDETSAKNKFGVDIIHIDIREILDIFKNIKDKEINELKNSFSNDYDNISLTDEQFSISTRMALCYKKIIEKYNLPSIANYCQTTMYHPEIGIPPCLGTTYCTSRGVPFSCEGDIGSAIAMLVVKELSGDSAFAENWMLDYEKNCVLLGHCGQGNLNYAAKKDEVRIAPHPAFKESVLKGASLNFSYKDGKSTLLNISPDNDCNWKMVIASGEVKHYPPVNMGAPHAWWESSLPVDDFVEKWCTAGSSHHAALGYGDLSETLKKLGSFLDLNIIQIK
ncbi:MAG: hypothetical protein NT148_00730, partial [Candidatus Nealsonbacteria bacterium]|nr:hypothetical protein [Candidatus Nealsonbacteria bacterium]